MSTELDLILDLVSNIVIVAGGVTAIFVLLNFSKNVGAWTGRIETRLEQICKRLSDQSDQIEAEFRRNHEQLDSIRADASAARERITVVETKLSGQIHE